jgi:hypothetical protein
MLEYMPCVLEAWATWECLRRLGFAADDLFWIVGNTVNAIGGSGLTLSIVLRTQGKQFSITCSPRLSDAEVMQLRSELAPFQEKIAQGSFDEAQMQEVFEASFVWRNKVDLLFALEAKGFRIPLGSN